LILFSPRPCVSGNPAHASPSHPTLWKGKPSTPLLNPMAVEPAKKQAEPKASKSSRAAAEGCGPRKRPSTVPRPAAPEGGEEQGPGEGVCAACLESTGRETQEATVTSRPGSHTFLKSEKVLISTGLKSYPRDPPAGSLLVTGFVPTKGLVRRRRGFSHQ